MPLGWHEMYSVFTQPNYARPEEVLRRLFPLGALRANHAIMLLAIAMINDHNKARMPIARRELQDYMGVSLKTIWVVRDELLEKGLIEVVYRNVNGAASWDVLLDALQRKRV